MSQSARSASSTTRARNTTQARSQPSATRRKRFTLETETQRLSDATIDRIRAAARRFVRAGGSIFPSSNPSDQDEHIGNVVKELEGIAGEEFERELANTVFADPNDEGRISNAAGIYVAETSDAAFLFGAFVGLELAALTGRLQTVIPAGGTARRKGGAR